MPKGIARPASNIPMGPTIWAPLPEPRNNTFHLPYQIRNTKQYAKLLKEKHVDSCEKAETTYQNSNPLKFLQTFFWVKLQECLPRQHEDEYT